MKCTENNAADQLLVKFGEGLGQNGGLFWHIPDRTQLNAGESGSSIFLKHPLPIWIAGIICEFYTPRTGRITNFNHLIASLF